MNFQNLLAKLPSLIVPLVLAFLIFIIGRMISGKVANAAERLFNKSPNADPSLSRFFASLVRYLILLIAIVAALTVLGVDMTSVSGMIVGLGAAMAFILQDSLGNLAAGVMMMIFRPFVVGDDVEIGGVRGIVTAVELTATRMKTTDNTEIIVANSKAWDGIIRNHTAYGVRRIDLDFGIDYSADIDRAIEVLTTAVASDPRVHANPAPWAKVVCLNESSVDLQLRIWCDAKDLRGLKVSISQPIKEALDAAGIGIPYPHEVKIKQSVTDSKARGRRQKLHAAKLKNS